MGPGGDRTGGGGFTILSDHVTPSASPMDQLTRRTERHFHHDHRPMRGDTPAKSDKKVMNDCTNTTEAIYTSFLK